MYNILALRNVQGMTQGSSWLRRTGLANSNDLWHWFKHARPVLGLTQADMGSLPSPEAYLALGRAVCRYADRGGPGSRIAHRLASGPANTDFVAWDTYVVWCKPPGVAVGLFAAVVDRLTHGELATLFAPDDGESYFQREIEKGARPLHRVGTPPGVRLH